MNEPHDETAPQPRKKWLAAGLGLLAVGVLTTGVLVLQPEAAPKASEPIASIEPSAEPVPTPDPTVASKVAASVDAAPGQKPGTVMLPGGGTAKLVRVEVTKKAVLPIPQGLDEAAWWGAKLGADKGAALLSGHVNWAGKKGPFDVLWGMSNGQDVTVMDTAGGKWVYRVTSVVTLHKNDLPKQARALFGQTGPHRLVLVTCGGDYVGGTQGYRDNRVVTAELVSRP
ncbi:Sortase family protein [Amycolatopsis xylanica]|uniref:Sortase family protein n=1 Tax=Amycolatopsis xylanica TaxID=589385 RepID=A0A1H3H838_9PSEU|nr:class F sortase [Amycolatopsis xylanica]SDY11577.1 Sortase family protein [Amycolatopsis xylanica]